MVQTIGAGQLGTASAFKLQPTPSHCYWIGLLFDKRSTSISDPLRLACVQFAHDVRNRGIYPLVVRKVDIQLHQIVQAPGQHPEGNLALTIPAGSTIGEQTMIDLPLVSINCYVSVQHVGQVQAIQWQWVLSLASVSTHRIRTPRGLFRLCNNLPTMVILHTVSEPKCE